MTNMIQSAKDQVSQLTQAAYEKAAAAGLLPAGAAAPPVQQRSGYAVGAAPCGRPQSLPPTGGKVAQCTHWAG